MTISNLPRDSSRFSVLRIRPSFFLLLLLFVSAGSGCSDPGVDLENLALAGSNPGPFAVDSTTLTLEDTTREVPSRRDYPASPTRTLVTEVWYPSPVEHDGEGPFPLIIFSHGFTSFRTQSDYLTEHLAGHGYVVAAPDFPLTNGLAPGGAYMPDVVNQPGDVSFLIDSFIGFTQDSDNRFYAMIDQEAIGALGHSFGGLTTILASHSADLGDPRIAASFALAPFACFLDEDFFSVREVPIFIMGGDIDIIAPFESNMRQPFGLARPPKYLVEIDGATHLWFMTANMPDEPAFLMLAEGIQSGDSTSEMMEIVSVAGGNIAGCSENLGLFSGEPPDVSTSRGDPDRQREAAKVYATAFFGFHLKDENKWEPILSEDFDRLNPDIEYMAE